MLGVVMDRFQYFVIHGVGANKVCGVEAMGRFLLVADNDDKEGKQQCLMMFPRWVCLNGCARPARNYKL